MCNYPLVFVIVNPVVNIFNVHHAATEQINKTLLQRSNNVWCYSFSRFKKKNILIEYFTYFCRICLYIYKWMTSLDCELVSSTLLHDIYLDKRCYVCPRRAHCNIPEIYQSFNKTLLQRSNKVWYYSFLIFKKNILIECFTYLCIICL